MGQFVLLLVVVGFVTANGLALAAAVSLTVLYGFCWLVFGPRAMRAALVGAARCLRR